MTDIFDLVADDIFGVHQRPGVNGIYITPSSVAEAYRAEFACGRPPMAACGTCSANSIQRCSRLLISDRFTHAKTHAPLPHKEPQ